MAGQLADFFHFVRVRGKSLIRKDFKLYGDEPG